MPVTAAPLFCIVCGKPARDELLLDGLLHECGSCGFLWTARRRQTPAGQLYGSDYFVSGGYRDYFRRAAQWRFEARRRLHWLLSAVRPATLLEAGSAGGFFLEAARAAGIVVQGVDTSKTCASFAATSLGLTVSHGDFESVELDAPVEAVCAFHVLEHVDDPRRFLARAAGALVPGGWLAVEVPNIASAAAARQGGSWGGLQPEYHHWHFDRRSLEQLLGASGFRVQHVDTVLPRHYMRPVRPLRHSAASRAVVDLARYGSLRTVHPEHGDYLRVLARRGPEEQPVRRPPTDAGPGR